MLGLQPQFSGFNLEALLLGTVIGNSGTPLHNVPAREVRLKGHDSVTGFESCSSQSSPQPLTPLKHCPNLHWGAWTKHGYWLLPWAISGFLGNSVLCRIIQTCCRCFSLGGPRSPYC